MAKRENSRDFLSKFMGREEKRLKDRDKHSVISDRWDRQDLQSILDELPEAAKSDDKLAEFVDTGHHAWGDQFFSLVKAVPDHHDDADIMPEFTVNKHISEEEWAIKEFQQLRDYTTGDPIATAMACISMEPTLETLFDKFKEEQKLAKNLQQQMQQMEGLQDQQRDLDEMMQEWEDAGGDPNDPNASQPRNYQEQSKLIQEQMEKLKQQMEKTAQELQQGLNHKKAGTQAALRQAAKDATDEQQQVESAALMWGQDPGSIHTLDAKTRLEFARKVQTPKFRKIAQLIGPLTRLALAEQSRKTEHGRDEIHDISLGNDLSRILPSELINLMVPELEWDFYRRYSDAQLLQYELRGEDKVAKGGIIFCEDSSGSMAGDREIWAKAIGLALLHIARKQNRAFYGINFGGPGAIKCFDFRDPKLIDPDKVMEFASMMWNGGTDFMTPLSHALDVLKEEYDAEGAVKGDIVFVTDGQCGVSDTWLEEYKKEQERLGFRVWGINIGGHRQDEPLYTIADHRVCTVTDLTSGSDVRDVFRGI